MSIYRWLFEGMFDVEDKAVIYLFTAGHSAWAAYPEYDEVWIDLMPINTIDTYIKGKLATAGMKEQPSKTCPDWMCNYCAFTDVCTYHTPKEEEHHEFGNEK